MVRMKYRIQKLIYRDQVQSGVIKRIYNLLIAQPKVHREAYELNKQPVRWINFKNGYYDPVTGKMLEHNPDYLTINQIPFPYYPEDCEQVLQGGGNIKKYLASSLPNKEEQQTFWEYFGYCMTQDTQFQKFLTLKGNGGTGKSVAVSLIQYVVGITNMSSISLQDLNKRFYATGMYGKLLNACADIPCKAMENTDVLKKAVGEGTLIYEKKGQDEEFAGYYRQVEAACEGAGGITGAGDGREERVTGEKSEDKRVYPEISGKNTQAENGKTEAILRESRNARRNSEVKRRNSSFDNRNVRNTEVESIASAEQRRFEE